MEGIARSPLGRLTVQNGSPAAVRLEDKLGFVRATVPPGSARTVTTWAADHKVFVAGRWAATFDSAFHDVELRPAAKGLGVSLARDARTKAGQGPGGSGGMLGARLRIEG